MKHDDLILCIEALISLRQEMHQEMSTSVAGRLDEVILSLQDCLEAGGQDVKVPTVVRIETLAVLTDALRLVSNFSELVRLWMGMS